MVMLNDAHTGRARSRTRASGRRSARPARSSTTSASGRCSRSTWARTTATTSRCPAPATYQLSLLDQPAGVGAAPRVPERLAEAPPRQRQLPLEARRHEPASRSVARHRADAPAVSDGRRRALAAAAPPPGSTAGRVDSPSAGERRVTRPPPVALGRQPAGLPARQHAWKATLARDADGNPVAPRFDRLLFFDVRGRPRRRPRAAAGGGAAHARAPVPLGTRTGSCSRPAGARGTSRARCGRRRRSRGASAVGLRAAGDRRLRPVPAPRLRRRAAAGGEVEAALVHGAPLPGADGPLDARRGARPGGRPGPASSAPVCPPPISTSAASRPGDPVPDDRAAVHGLQVQPAAQPGHRGRGHDRRRPVRGAAPRCRSATCACGWTAGTATSIERERVARMYAPQVTPAQVAHFTTDAESDPSLLGQAINRYGVIGHAQTSARARRHGKPLILRRDFNTVDGGQAGLHFVSLQRTIDDFVTTRTAMNASVRPAAEPSDHRHRQQRHQRVHLRRCAAPTTSCPRAPAGPSRVSAFDPRR